MLNPSPNLSLVRLLTLKMGQNAWQPAVQLSCPFGSLEKKYRVRFCLSTRYLPRVALVCRLISFCTGVGELTLLSSFLQFIVVIIRPLISAIAIEIFIVFIFLTFHLFFKNLCR